MDKGEQPRYLTVNEAAQALGVTPLTIRRYIYRGLLDSKRTPGGQHRIRMDDLLVLKKDSCGTQIGDVTAWQVRVQNLEKEVTLLRKQLAVVSSGCIKLKEMVEEPLAAKSGNTAEKFSGKLVLSVLGPGCHACDSLAALTEEILQDLRLDDARVKRVKDLEKIAEYGPLLTPALVLGGHVVMSGFVPSREQLARIIKAGVN